MTDVAMWVIGQENAHKSRHKTTQEVEEETNRGRKMCILSRKGTERQRISCDWSPGNDATVSVFFFKADTDGSVLERVPKSREQRCSLQEKATRLRLECNQVLW